MHISWARLASDSFVGGISFVDNPLFLLLILNVNDLFHILVMSSPFLFFIHRAVEERAGC